MSGIRVQWLPNPGQHRHGATPSVQWLRGGDLHCLKKKLIPRCSGSEGLIFFFCQAALVFRGDEETPPSPPRGGIASKAVLLRKAKERIAPRDKIPEMLKANSARRYNGALSPRGEYPVASFTAPNQCPGRGGIRRHSPQL